MKLVQNDMTEIFTQSISTIVCSSDGKNILWWIFDVFVFEQMFQILENTQFFW